MKNAGKACNNRLYRHIRTFEKIVKNYFVISIKKRSNADFDISSTESIHTEPGSVGKTQAAFQSFH